MFTKAFIFVIKPSFVVSYQNRAEMVFCLNSFQFYWDFLIKWVEMTENIEGFMLLTSGLVITTCITSLTTNCYHKCVYIIVTSLCFHKITIVIQQSPLQIYKHATIIYKQRTLLIYNVCIENISTYVFI